MTKGTQRARHFAEARGDLRFMPVHDYKDNPNEANVSAKERMSPEDFVILWNRAHSMEHFLSFCNMRRSTAYARAVTYRKKGVKLKHHGGSLVTIDRINDVKRLAEETADIWEIDAVLERFSSSLTKGTK